jgi:hypothetical protein
MRASETIGITALDTLCRHGRACPGRRDAEKRCAPTVEITGTRPVMTKKIGAS